MSITCRLATLALDDNMSSGYIPLMKSTFKQTEAAAILANRIRDLFSYDPVAGRLTRIGAKKTGVLHHTGYVYIKFSNRRFAEHHLVWLYHKGEWARGWLDHRNGDRADNRIENLREASASQNTANSKLLPHSTSGFKGVSLRPNGRWQARITLNRQTIQLGMFDSAEEAHAAYAAAAHEHFGEFARTE